MTSPLPVARGSAPRHLRDVGVVRARWDGRTAYKASPSAGGRLVSTQVHLSPALHSTDDRAHPSALLDAVAVLRVPGSDSECTAHGMLSWMLALSSCFPLSPGAVRTPSSLWQVRSASDSVRASPGRWRMPRHRQRSLELPVGGRRGRASRVNLCSSPWVPALTRRLCERNPTELLTCGTSVVS
ncbi:hypothetical protein K466DRAFT_668296 [Polyporus arcularius HHB13444]|uniref:Uncharacterized protein n=1 Tax=Polyporus arcularius HHB13444 TaxID=1314778 RepID=A0A5C3NRA4_9APHY|nr:hypothetical protein K466DRAFT_668296 [Polyporus arcularius HHB13444]